MILDAIKSVGGSLLGLADKYIPDKDKANELKAAINLKLLELEQEYLKASAGVINTEAKGESWLQRNWRPITMLTFTGLIVAHWLGFTPENLTEKEVLGLLDIVQIGLGGYVLGRSAEKVAKNWKN